MRSSVLSFPAFSFRRIETPYEKSPGYKNYLAVVDIADMPNLDDWRQINVRDAKLVGRVPRAIRDSLTERADEFVFLNRGLVLSAESVEFTDKDKTLRLTMKNPQVHGLLDGGHTYKVIGETKPTLGEEEPARYVKMEILTGFDADGIVQVVDARNTSNQVQDESLDNLMQKFEPLKQVLSGQDYFDQISWSEYSETDGRPRPISVRDIVAFLICFDVDEFNGNRHPLIAYKDKRACLRHYRDGMPRIKKYINLLPEILMLWDEIHENWFDWYSEGRQDEAGKPGRPGSLTGINRKVDERLYFKGSDIKGRIPDSYKFPVLAALRSAVEAKNGASRWATDPFKLLKSVGPRLVSAVGNAIRRELNPNKVGKDIAVWSNCFVIAESDAKIKKLEAELSALRNRK